MTQLHVPAPQTSIYRTLLEMDIEQLEEFRLQLRRRYSRNELIDELTACAERLGKSPTMREFAADVQASIHPQTIVDHFGSWNTAKREAGLMPRRQATREELLMALRCLGDTLGRQPSANDIEKARGVVPSKGVYIREFGSVRAALEAAGFDAPSREAKLERTVDFAVAAFLETGQLPGFRDWERLRGSRTDILSAWQIYRTFESTGGSWSAFQFTVSQRAEEIIG